jgi:hypothetical protein
MFCIANVFAQYHHCGETPTLYHQRADPAASLPVAAGIRIILSTPEIHSQLLTELAIDLIRSIMS